MESDEWWAVPMTEYDWIGPLDLAVVSNLDLSNAVLLSRQSNYFTTFTQCTATNRSLSSTNTLLWIVNTNSFVKWVKALMASFGTLLCFLSWLSAHSLYVYSAAKDTESGEQVAIKKVSMRYTKSQRSIVTLLYQGVQDLWEEHPCQTCLTWSEAPQTL